MAFKKGNKANAEAENVGKPPKKIGTWQEVMKWRTQEEIKGKLTKEDLRDISNWLLCQTKEELKKITEETNAPVIVVMLARAMMRDVSQGSLYTFNNIYEKFIADKNDRDLKIKFVSGIDMGDEESNDDNQESDDSE